MSDQFSFKLALLGLLRSAGFTNLDAQIANTQRDVYSFDLTDEADADGSATPAGIVMPFACRVVAAYATAPVAVTANATNYATFTASKRAAATGTETAIGVFATDTVTTDDMVAFVPKTLTVTAADAVLAAGDTLCAKLTKAASGVATVAATATTVHGSFAKVTVVVERI
jgi:hypothetical protein